MVHCLLQGMLPLEAQLKLLVPMCLIPALVFNTSISVSIPPRNYDGACLVKNIGSQQGYFVYDFTSNLFDKSSIQFASHTTCY